MYATWNNFSANCTTDNYRKDDGWACGFLLADKLTRSEASAQCGALGARLPEIISAEENYALNSIMVV